MASSDQPNNAVPLNEQNVTDTSNAAHWIALAFVLGFVSLGPSGVLQVKSDLLHTCFKSILQVSNFGIWMWNSGIQIRHPNSKFEFSSVVEFIDLRSQCTFLVELF